MKNKRTNWPITIGLGVALGLATLIILKNSLRDVNAKVSYRVKIDLTALTNAMEKYRSHYKAYPETAKGKVLCFAEQLSPTAVSPDNKESREMFIDYTANKMSVSNPNYAAPNADPTTVLDPWGQAYLYEKTGADSFVIWSTGADMVNSNRAGDDIHWEVLPEAEKIHAYPER
jgi:hypothetical protein